MTTGCLCTEGDRAHTAAIGGVEGRGAGRAPSSRRGCGSCSARVGTRRSRRCGPTARRGSRASSSRMVSSGSGRCRARKGADLRRDPRFALRGPAFHPQEGKEAGSPGEAKIAGRAVPARPAGEGPAGDLFRADISEVVATRLNREATLLVIESWTPQRGLRVVERECRGTPSKPHVRRRTHCPKRSGDSRGGLTDP
jgi:hypothetical protein